MGTLLPFFEQVTLGVLPGRRKRSLTSHLYDIQEHS